MSMCDIFNIKYITKYLINYLFLDLRLLRLLLLADFLADFLARDFRTEAFNLQRLDLAFLT